MIRLHRARWRRRFAHHQRRRRRHPSSLERRDPHAATSLAGDVASQERQLSEALARAKAAHERAERLERDNEQLASTSSTAIAEKMAEIDKLKREIKVLKHATTAPADLVASMQNRDDNEAALEKLKSEHDEMTSLANQEFARRDREVQLLRQLVLEPAFEGWLAKQGGGNLSRAWKDRFFVLRNGVLSYFQNEDDEETGRLHAHCGRDSGEVVEYGTRLLVYDPDGEAHVFHRGAESVAAGRVGGQAGRDHCNIRGIDKEQSKQRDRNDNGATVATASDSENERSTCSNRHTKVSSAMQELTKIDHATFLI
jgi:hypothetical protein